MRIALVVALVVLGACGPRGGQPSPATSPGASPSASPTATPLEDTPTPEPTSAPRATSTPRLVRPDPTPLPTARPGERVTYDTSARACRPARAPSVDRQWEASVDPREAAPDAEVRLGLRNASGTEQETYVVTAIVYAPDGSSTRSRTEVNGDVWTYVRYPNQFGGAPSRQASGVHTVVWETPEGQVACDGFTVR